MIISRRLRQWLTPSLIALAFGLATLTVGPAGRANVSTESDEVTYDELVQKLAQRSRLQQRPARSAVDSLWIHTSLGVTSSWTTLRTDKGNLREDLQGMQLSLGIDLFHPDWIAEGSLRNLSAGGPRARTLRELDLRLIYRLPSPTMFRARFAAGLSQRQLRFETDTQDIQETTPAWILSAGAELVLSKEFSLLLEPSYRNPMITNARDRGALDATIRGEIHF